MRRITKKGEVIQKQDIKLTYVEVLFLEPHTVFSRGKGWCCEPVSMQVLVSPAGKGHIKP